MIFSSPGLSNVDGAIAMMFKHIIIFCPEPPPPTTAGSYIRKEAGYIKPVPGKMIGRPERGLSCKWVRTGSMNEGGGGALGRNFFFVGKKEQIYFAGGTRRATMATAMLTVVTRTRPWEQE